MPADRPWYTVTVRQRIELAGLDLLHHYPRYLGRKPEPVENASGHVEAPLGTRVEVRLRLKSPAPGARLILQDGTALPMAAEDGGRAYTAGFQVVADSAYRIELTDRSAVRTLHIVGVNQ